MKSIEKITEHTLVIKKSEFICTLIPLNDEEKIKDMILTDADTERFQQELFEAIYSVSECRTGK